MENGAGRSVAAVAVAGSVLESGSLEVGTESPKKPRDGHSWLVYILPNTFQKYFWGVLTDNALQRPSPPPDLLRPFHPPGLLRLLRLLLFLGLFGLLKFGNLPEEMIRQCPLRVTGQIAGHAFH